MHVLEGLTPSFLDSDESLFYFRGSLMTSVSLSNFFTPLEHLSDKGLPQVRGSNTVHMLAELHLVHEKKHGNI